MKKNAILIAGILFVAGCATHQGGYPSASSGSGSYSYEPRDHTVRSAETIDRNAQGEPIGAMDMTTAGQYDSANFHADSSKRGGSNEARGLRSYGRTDYDTATQPMNPAVQADSSIRGGSIQARDRDWNTSPQVFSGSESGRVKADSSIRGGSNEARGFNRNADRSDLRSDDTDADNRAELDMYRGAEARQNYNAQATSGGMDAGTAANWNPSDDLMRDGTQAGGALSYDRSQTPNTSVWNVEPLVPLDDMTISPQDQPSGVGTSGTYQSQSGSSQASASPESSSPDKGNLNSSKQLERDISGNYNIENQQGKRLSLESNGQLDQNASGTFDSSFNSSRSSDISHDQKSSLGLSTSGGQVGQITSGEMSTEDVGGPGSSETGSSSSSDSAVTSGSSDSAPRSQVGITTDQENWLYRNNRAQGVGSTATGESGVANSTDSQLAGMNDQQLAEKVKKNLVKESTGTYSITQAEARAIKVSAHDGVVSLQGSVPTEKDKKLVEIRANEMSGVKRVDNQLTVSPNANPASRDLGSGRNLEDSTDQFNKEAKD